MVLTRLLRAGGRENEYYNYLSALEGAIHEDALEKILCFLETGKKCIRDFRGRLFGDDKYPDKERRENKS